MAGPPRAEGGRARGGRGVLRAAPERRHRLALRGVGEPPAGHGRRPRLLRGVPAAEPAVRPTARAFLAAALGIALAAVTALIALDGGDPASPFRHGYLPPVVVAALRWGAPGGAAAAGPAMLLLAPAVPPETEPSGPPPHAAAAPV